MFFLAHDDESGHRAGTTADDPQLVVAKSFADEVVTQLALDYVERKPANDMVIF
jgi:hypothetical protein